MAIRDLRVLAADLMLGEAPRWHDGRLHVSDMYAEEVVAIGLDGRRETLLTIDGQPGGLGWLPGGDLLVTSMRDATVLRCDGSLVEPIACAAPASPLLNDLVVAPGGRAYVGGMADLDALVGDPDGPSALDVTLPPEHIHLVEAGDAGAPATCRVVAEGVDFPNGMVVTGDGLTLIVAETMGHRLLAFDVEPDGSLTRRRVWADLGELLPDGICLDAEGCVWVAVPEPAGERGFVRVAEGGAILSRRRTDRSGVAVALGGPEGTQLFMVEAEVMAVAEAEAVRTRGNSRVVVGTVEVPASPPPCAAAAGVNERGGEG